VDFTKLLSAYGKTQKLLGGLEHFLFFPSFFGNVIIPTDFRIFFRWVAQPPTRKWFATLHGLTALAASNLSPETLDAFGVVAIDSLFPEKNGLKRLPGLVNIQKTMENHLLMGKLTINSYFQ